MVWLFKIFEYLNINLFDDSNPAIYLFVIIMFLAGLSLLGVFNISLYLLSIYIIDNKLEYFFKYLIKYPMLKK